MATNILIVVGTARQGRSGRKIADWYLSEAKKAGLDIDFSILDVAELALPIFNEMMPPMMHQYNETQQAIADKVAAADGFVFITAEYNHSVSGSLKNFMDYINAEWHHKAAAFVGYGTTGAVRAIEHMIQILAELRVASVATGSDHIHINAPWEALDENGVPKESYVHGSIPAQLTELKWWSDALKVARG